ncbi:type 1 fimbrial protein [Burkholderia sp. Bp9002]|nr:type 1 fimbrial protein [Burkholderia sp. Bp9002]
MKHRLIAASFALAASLLASSPSFADGVSGIIRFTGMIVEPPCSFDVDAGNPARASVRPACPRPASGQIAFVDAATRQAIKTTSFTQASRAIVLPNRPGNDHAPMIAIVTYQ